MVILGYARVSTQDQHLTGQIETLTAAGATSLRAIADGLNRQNIPTARGGGEWTATQVMRVLERLPA